MIESFPIYPTERLIYYSLTWLGDKMSKSKKWMVYYKGITFKNNVLRVCPQLVSSEVTTVPQALYSTLAYQLCRVAYIKTAENHDILTTAGTIIRECLPKHSTWRDLQGYANRSSYRLKVPTYYKSLAVAVKTQLLKLCTLMQQMKNSEMNKRNSTNGACN